MSIVSPKQKKRYCFYNMTCNAPEQPPQAESQTLNITGNTSSNVEAGVRKMNSIHRSRRKSDSLIEREKGSFCFLIITVSYNARYAKLREVKNANFPDFWRFSPGWLIFGLGSTVLRILHFLSYFIVFFVSCLQIVSALCAAASVR